MTKELKRDRSSPGLILHMGLGCQVLLVIPPALRGSSGPICLLTGLPLLSGLATCLWPLQTCFQRFLYIWVLAMMAVNFTSGTELPWLQPAVVPLLDLSGPEDVFIPFPDYFMADGPRNSFSNPLNLLEKNHSLVPSEGKLLTYCPR